MKDTLKALAPWVMIICLIIVVILLCFSIINVPAGYKAVVVNGMAVGHQFDEGWNFKNPLSGVRNERYNTQMVTERLSVRSEDGYNVDADYTVRYHLTENEVGYIVLTNPDYIDTTIVPELRSVARKVVADNNWTGEDINRERTIYEFEVATQLTPILANYDIIAEAILIRNIDFPIVVNTAWEARAAAEVDVETAEFELNAERQRAIIQVVQANAEKNSTIIISEGQAEALYTIMTQFNLTNQSEASQAYLSWLYLRALTSTDSNIQYVLGDNPYILSLAEESTP